MSTNNIPMETAQEVSQEVCDKIEKIIKTLKEVHNELHDTINDVYLFCTNHTRNEDFNYTMYMNSLYNPNKDLETLLGKPVYSKGLDQYCCAVVYEDHSSVVHTTAVTMFIPSKWVNNADFCKEFIVSELCNSMLTHLRYSTIDLACSGDYETLYIKLNHMIIASGNVENLYNIKEINDIIAAYNSTFEKTDTETGMSIYEIADALDNIYTLGSVFVREIYKINPRNQYAIDQKNEYIHIKGLKAKNLYASDLDENIELIIPKDMYNKSEEDMKKYFTKYILSQIDRQVHEHKANIRKFLEKHKQHDDRYDRDFVEFSHIITSLDV